MLLKAFAKDAVSATRVCRIREGKGLERQPCDWKRPCRRVFLPWPVGIATLRCQAVRFQGPRSAVGPQRARGLFWSKGNSRCCAGQRRRKSCSSHQLWGKITLFSPDHLHSVTSSLGLVGTSVSRFTPEFGGLSYLCKSWIFSSVPWLGSLEGLQKDAWDPVGQVAPATNQRCLPPARQAWSQRWGGLVVVNYRPGS